MSTSTTNYKFVKSDELEMYDVNVVNANLDAIDTKIKEVDEKAGNIDLSSLQTQIDKKSEIDHKHAISDVTNLQYSLDSRSLVTHKHPISDVTDLQTTLDSKLDASHDDATRHSKYTTSYTTRSVSTKVVSYTNFTLILGARVTVQFYYDNTSVSPYMNVNNTGVKRIYLNGTLADGTTNTWQSNDIVEFIYDGSVWQGFSSKLANGYIDSNFSERLSALKTTLDSKASNESLNTHLGDNVYLTLTGTSTLVGTHENVKEYKVGMLLAFKNTTQNTGSVTININSLGAKSLRKSNGTTLSSGNLKANGVYQARYDGSNFFLLGEGGEYGTAGATQVLEGFTVGTENGIVAGALKKGATIKSVQRGRISLGESNSAAVSISPIMLTKSIIKVTYRSRNSVGRGGFVLATFINNSSIRLSTGAYSTPVTVEWEVIEFDAGVNIQSGALSITEGSQFYSSVITPFDPNRSYIEFSFLSSGYNNETFSHMVSGYLSGGKSVAFYREGIANIASIQWFVVEFLS